MSSLTRENIDELMKAHGLRSGYELKIMGKDDQITGVQFSKRPYVNYSVEGLPEKRSIINDGGALERLEKELVVNFGQRNRLDSAKRIVNNFKQETQRYLLPDGAQVAVPDLESEIPSLQIHRDGQELASVELNDWNLFLQTNDPKSYAAKASMISLAKQHGELIRRVGPKNNREYIEASTNRFVLPEGQNVAIARDHGTHHSVSVPGVEKPLKTYDPEFEAKFEQAMLAAGLEKHAVEFNFSMKLDWNDISDEDGYGFEPNLAEDDLLDEIRDAIQLETAYSIIGDEDIEEDKILPQIDVKLIAKGDANIVDVDYDENIPARIRLKHMTVNDMPDAWQEMSAQVLMSPEFPVSAYTLDLIKDSVKDFLVDNYSMDDESFEIEVKPSSHGLPLRGLREELTSAFEHAIAQYSILEPAQKASKLNDIVKDVLGYTAPMEQEISQGFKYGELDAPKLVSLVETTIEERMVKDMALESKPEVKPPEQDKPEQDQDITPSINQRFKSS